MLLFAAVDLEKSALYQILDVPELSCHSLQVTARSVQVRPVQVLTQMICMLPLADITCSMISLKRRAINGSFTDEEQCMLCYLRDPLQFVHANIGSYDLLHSSRDGTGVEANLGFYYVKATRGGQALLNATLETHIKQPKLWDQQVSTLLELGSLGREAALVQGNKHKGFVYPSPVYPNQWNQTLVHLQEMLSNMCMPSALTHCTQNQECSRRCMLQ